MPAWMYDKEGNRKPQYKGVKYKPKKDKKKTIDEAMNKMKMSKKGVPQERRVTKLWHEHKGNK